MREITINLRNCHLALGLLLFATLRLISADEPASLPQSAASTPEIRQKVENFRLLDHSGRSHELYRYRNANAVVLVFVGNGCPIVRQSLPTLKTLREEFKDKGVTFLLLNSNSQDDHASIVEETREFSIDFPVLEDSFQLVARMLHAKRTAEAIAIDPKTWTIFYRGAIDDRLDYGTQKPAATKHFLKDALQNLLAGKPVNLSTSPVKGCAITFTEPSTTKEGPISYASHVAPILNDRCVTCHSAGNIGPFAMSSYGKVKGWASTIREVILQQRMPPWHADPHHGQFANDLSLRPDEAKTLIEWIEQGSPRGSGEDPLAQSSAQTTEWPLGKPDFLLPLPEQQDIPATGLVDYRYITVDSPIPEDAWLSAAIVRPGNRKVLHHCLIFVTYPKELEHLQPKYQGGAGGFFTGYVPGTGEAPFPENTGKFVPKGSKFIFQLHYTTSGKPEKDLTQLALYLSPSKPKMELHTKAATMLKLQIPPGDPDWETSAEYRIKQDALLYSLSPHMHFRGSRFEYKAEYPDGRSEVLLSVPHYDFNWQHLYQFSEPKLIPANTRIVARGAFDNSPQNPANPDPTKTVKWGDQTFNEMFIGYINFSYLGTAENNKTETKTASIPVSQADLYGQWKVSMNLGARTQNYDLLIEEFEGKLEASLIHPRTGKQKFSSASFQNDILSLEMDRGGKNTFVYTGKFEGKNLAGTASVKGFEAFGAGEWTASKD